MNWQSVCVGTAFAVFIVWMERKGRWTLFAAAASGDYSIANSRNNVGGTGYPATPGVTLPPTGGGTINVPGRGLENPAPSPGWGTNPSGGAPGL